MPPRATWKGHLKVSLVQLGVRLYNATSSANRITLNQLHRKTNARLKQRMVDPTTGDEAEREEIVKGYEYEKGRYVIIDQEDLDKIKLPSTKTIEITTFVDADSIEPIYLNSPYYLAPDGPVAEEAFCVIRDAMRASGKAGVGKLVMAGREHVVAVGAHDKGMMLNTLRYASEVRAADPYFDEIHDHTGDTSQIKMAEQLIESLAGEFDPESYSDHYQDALLKVVKAKIDGSEPVIAQEAEAAKTLNFMEALRASVGEAGAAKKKVAKKPPAKSVGAKKKKVRKKA